MIAGKLKVNLVYNLVGSILPILSALATVPLYIHHIGVARYGIVSICWLLLGYFGFLDFGLSRASANALSKLSGAPAFERSPVIMTSFWMNLGLGTTAGLIMLVGSYGLLLHVFSIPMELRREVFTALPWMAAMLPFGMLGGVATGILESRDRFLTSNLLSSIGSVAGQLLPLIVAVFYSPTLPYVIPAMLLARVAIVIATFGVALRLEQPIRPFDFQLVWVRRLLGYGAWVSVSSLISPLLDGLDQMLIGVVLGASSVAHYAVPMNLALRSQLVAVALARTLFPQLSRADPTQARMLAGQACIALAYAFGAICGPAIIMCHAFLSVWIGPSFATTSAPVAVVLLLGAWPNGVAFIPYSLLQGQGRPDITAKVHLVEIVPFIAMLWWLMHQFGLLGAAAAWTIRVAFDCVALLILSKFPRPSFLKLLPALALMLGSYGLANAENHQSAIEAGIVGIMFVGLGFFIEPLFRKSAVSTFASVGRLWLPVQRKMLHALLK